MASAKSSGAERRAAQVAGDLAEAEFRGGNVEAALRLAGEALAANRAGTNPQLVAICLCNMAAYHSALERYGEARTHARKALALLRDAQSDVVLVLTVQHLAAAEALRSHEHAARSSDDAEVGAGDAGAHAVRNTTGRTRAAWLLGYVDARLTALEAQREYTETQEYDKILPALRATLGERQLAALLDEGRAWTEDHAVTEALLV